MASKSSKSSNAKANQPAIGSQKTSALIDIQIAKLQQGISDLEVLLHQLEATGTEVLTKVLSSPKATLSSLSHEIKQLHAAQERSETATNDDAKRVEPPLNGKKAKAKVKTKPRRLPQTTHLKPPERPPAKPRKSSTKLTPATEPLEFVDFPPVIEAPLTRGISQANWHSLVNTIFQKTDLGVAVQQDGKCIFANDQIGRLLGQRADNLVGGNVLQLILNSNQQSSLPDTLSVEKIIEGAIAFGHCRTEIETLDADNQHRFLETLIQSSQENGNRYLVAFVKDITNQKLLEQQLRMGRDFNNKLINSVPDCFFVTDKNHHIVICNDSFCQMLQMDRDALLNRHISEVFHHDAALKLCEQGDNMFKFNLCERGEIALLGTEQSANVFSIRRNVFDDDESGEKFIVSSAEDVTHARRDQMQLKLLASAYRNAGEGIVILDRDGLFCEINPAFSKLTQYQAQELFGKPMKEIFDPVTVGSQADIYMTQICNLPEWNDRMIIRSKDGKCIHSWINVNQVLGPKGELSHIIAIFNDMSEMHETQERLRYQAFHDLLTQLPSRAYFHDRLHEILEKAQSDTTPFAVMFMDLDDFKNVNDTMGHNMGDALLQQVAKRLKKCLSENCFVSRFGGDEFAVIIPDIEGPGNDPVTLARLIIREIEQPFEIAGNQFFVGTSIGICQYPEHGKDIENLLRNSDTAMYRAKASGKNQFRVYSHELSSMVRRRMTLAAKLRTAAQRNEFNLVYQPKVELKTNRISSCESLLRWKLDDGNFVPPDEFIPIAEESGLIESIGEMVLETSCRAIKHWDTLNLGIDRIAINLSPRQFNHKFQERVLGILKDNDLEPARIEFEITETIMMDDAKKSAAIIRQLSNKGFHFSIDDFGTGHSSLGYLKHFQVNAIKIDRTFIRDLPEDQDALAIVQSILTLARSRKLPVVAEGVETLAQLELLRSEGCDYVQGYYFSKPLEIDEFQTFVANFSKNAQQLR